MVLLKFRATRFETVGILWAQIWKNYVGKGV